MNLKNVYIILILFLIFNCAKKHDKIIKLDKQENDIKDLNEKKVTNKINYFCSQQEINDLFGLSNTEENTDNEDITDDTEMNNIPEKYYNIKERIDNFAIINTNSMDLGGSFDSSTEMLIYFDLNERKMKIIHNERSLSWDYINSVYLNDDSYIDFIIIGGLQRYEFIVYYGKENGADLVYTAPGFGSHTIDSLGFKKTYIRIESLSEEWNDQTGIYYYDYKQNKLIFYSKIAE